VICKEVIGLIESVLIRGQAADEARVFYLKMAGDYYRYLAEFMDRSAGFHDKAKERYQLALDIATGDNEKDGNGVGALPSTHPIRLGLALNYSVCFYEILGEKILACKLARKAFEDAIKKLDELDEHSYKDSTLIMQLLRDNLTLWSSDSNWNDEAANDVNVQNVDAE
jgi:14-3-3 protein epsilon